MTGPQDITAAAIASFDGCEDDRLRELLQALTRHLHAFASEVELTHVNLNDRTLEGLRHRNLPAFSVQYHPEASPGPHDAGYLFDDFRRLMIEFRHRSPW